MAVVVQSMGLRVGLFSSADKFLQAYDPDEPCCLITDERMPGMSGLDLLRKFRRLAPRAPMILVTAYADVSLAVEAMRYRAMTVLEKPCQHHELRKAIRVALRRDQSRRPNMNKQRLITLRIDSLSEQEQEVMSSLLEGKPNKAIAGELDIGVRTVEKRRHDLLKKMKVSSVSELAFIVGRYTKLTPRFRKI